jgi:hypothetical protein
VRARVYLRIAPTARGFKYAATGKPSSAPLMNGYDALPTIAFGFDVNLPAGAFNVPVVGKLDVSESALHPVVAVELVEEAAS